MIDPAEYLRARRTCTRLAAAGPTMVEEWERQIAAMLSVPQAVAVQQEWAAFRWIFSHLAIADGDEVIIPAYGARSLADLIKRSGAKPVPADIEPHTLNVTVPGVAARITPRTRAIVVGHAFGTPAPIDNIVALADDYRIPVIEDCREALGAAVKGRFAGSFGYASTIAFGPDGPINTHGGAMILSRDTDLIRRIRTGVTALPFDPAGFLKGVGRNCRREYGRRSGLAWPLLAARAIRHGDDGCRTADPDVVFKHFGFESRYQPIQAKWGMARLKNLEERLSIRRERAALLESKLHSSMYVQQVLPGTASAWSRLVVVLSRRPGKVRRDLVVQYGIEAAIGDEIAHECARLLGYADCPGVVDAYFHALALPMYDGITETQVGRIARILNGLVR